MSVASSKIQELLQRAQALEQRLNSTQLEQLKKPSQKEKFDAPAQPRRVNSNKLSLKKKKKKVFLENKENEPSRKKKKDKLFGTIQFSSDEEQRDVEEVEECKKCESSTVGLQKAQGCSMSVDYPSSILQQSTVPSSMDILVPDSCEAPDLQSISNVSSQNISDIVRGDKHPTVNDTFSSEISDIVAGFVGDCADIHVIPETQQSKTTPRKPGVLQIQDSFEESEVAKGKTKPAGDSNSTASESLSSSKLSESNLEESVFMLSQRLEKILKVKNGKSKKTGNMTSSTADVSDVVISRSLSIDEPKITKKPKNKKKIQDTSDNRSKLFNAIYFSSSDDEVRDEVVEQPGTPSVGVADNKSGAENSAVSLSMSSTSDMSVVSATKSDLSHEDIASLTDRLDNILLTKPKAPKSTKKPSKSVPVSKKAKAKKKKIALPDLFDSESDDMEKYNKVISTDTCVQQPASDAAMSTHELSLDKDAGVCEEKQVEKRNLSLQVSISSTPGSIEGSPQSRFSSPVKHIHATSAASTPNNAKLKLPKSTRNTPCSPATMSVQSEIRDVSVSAADYSMGSSVCDVTNKSLQCSFSSPASDASQLHDKSPANVSRTAVHTDLQNPVAGTRCGSVSSPATDSSPLMVEQSVGEDTDRGTDRGTYRGTDRGTDRDTPVRCNISLQVSMSPSDISQLADAEFTDDDDSSSMVEDVLYKTAIDIASDISDPALYKTVVTSPLEALFDQSRLLTDDASLHYEDDSFDAGEENDDSSKYALVQNVAECKSQSPQSRDGSQIHSSGSEAGSQHGGLDSSGSESDEDRCTQRPRTRVLQADRDPGHAMAAIGPDQMYEPDLPGLEPRSPRQVQVSSDSSDDDELESFFQKMQKPVSKPKPSIMSDFIIADDELSSDEDDESIFYIRTNRVLSSNRPSRSHNSIKTPRSTASGKRSPSPPLGSPDMTDDDSDDQENVFKTPAHPVVKPTSHTCKPLLSKPVLSNINNFATPMRKVPSILDKRSLKFDRPNSTGHDAVRKGFLRSLGADMNDSERHLDSIKYVKNFKKHREELTSKLFKMYNETVFASKLPCDMTVTWNMRMYKTAGYCTYKKTAQVDQRTARVELSVKVCDSAERVRDTLIHELCHAAVWLFNGKTDGHGPYWKHWAHKANLVHRDLPVISRCHNYKIQTKYTYKCTKCGYQIGRHSKSLDTATKVCGYCMSPFELITNGKLGSKSGIQTPRAPNRFALFVKENYGSIKKQGKLSHQEVMTKLSSAFALQNKVST